LTFSNFSSEVVLKKKKNAMMFNQYKEYKKLFEILKEKSDSISKSGVIDPKGEGRVKTQLSANKSKLSMGSGFSKLSKKAYKSKNDNLEIKKLDYTASKLKR
jgi:hypothetical protein